MTHWSDVTQTRAQLEMRNAARARGSARRRHVLAGGGSEALADSIGALAASDYLEGARKALGDAHASLARMNAAASIEAGRIDHPAPVSGDASAAVLVLRSGAKSHDFMEPVSTEAAQRPGAWEKLRALFTGGRHDFP